MPSKSNQSTLIKRITYGAFLSFFLFGFADNLKGPTFPALLDELNFSYSVGGTMMLVAYLGFLVATLSTGPLSDMAGKRVVMFIACACLFVGMTGYSVFSAFWMLSGAMAIIGLGLGSLEVGGNLIIVDLHRRDKGRLLNLLAFFHSVGSMIAPLYAGRLLELGVSWRRIYQSGVLIVVFLFIYFLLTKYPRTNISDDDKPAKKLGKSAFTGEMILFYVVIAVYVAAEIGIGSWLVEFLQKAKSQSVMTSSLFLSLFFGAITAGRFIGSFLVERAGYLRSMLYAALASVVCAAIGIFAPASLAFFLPLTGLFFSIIFPTATAAVSDLHKENLGTILGLLFTFAGLGGMLGPWTIGVFSDWVGIRIGFGMILVFCVGMSVTFGLLASRRNRTTDSTDRTD
ncbi:MAG: MFS transporter [Anaerolineae bacterium]|jgi:fucose permease